MSDGSQSANKNFKFLRSYIDAADEQLQARGTNWGQHNFTPHFVRNLFTRYQGAAHQQPSHQLEEQRPPNPDQSSSSTFNLDSEL